MKRLFYLVIVGLWSVPAFAASVGHGTGDVDTVSGEQQIMQQIAQWQQANVEILFFVAGLLTALIVAATWRY